MQTEGPAPILYQVAELPEAVEQHQYGLVCQQCGVAIRADLPACREKHSAPDAGESPLLGEA